MVPSMMKAPDMEAPALPEDRLKQIQVYISRMPSLSTTVTKVLEVCNNPDTSPDELNRLISYDPVLAGQVLRLINSAYYSLPNRVTSLTRAIIMLGLNTVKNLVLATSVLASFKSTSAASRFSMDDYWAHCLCVGVTTKTIAKMMRIPVIAQEEYFVAGLLHDLGKLPMIACFADLYHQAMASSEDDEIPLYQAESRFIGFDHCQVGWLIGAKWKLSNDMKHAIMNHHRPLSEGCEPSDLLYAMSLGNQIAHHLQIGASGDGVGDEMMIQDLSGRISLKTEDILQKRPQIEDEVERARVFLKNSRKEQTNAH